MANQDVPPDRLAEILAAHELWVQSDHTQGEPADLTRANLQGRDLSRRNLRSARLHGANLQGATLECTIFREADLQAADLSGATGLLGEQLAGANLRHAILPKEILESDRLATVTETSRSAQTLLWSMLGACIYGWLTIWTTTDTGLLTNRTTSTLPIIGGTIPIGVFFVVMPLVLLGLYLYLHFQLQRLWEGLARLPAVFPDGRPLDQRVDLWLLSSFLRTYWVHLREGRGGSPTLFLLQKSFAILLVWGVVPITLVLFWGRYLAVHDLYGTAFHIGSLMVGIGATIGFRHLMAVTLSSKQARSPWNRSALVSAGAGVIILALLGSFSFGAIRGFPEDQSQSTIDMRDVHWRAPAVPPCEPSDMWKDVRNRIGVALPCNPRDIRIVVPWIFNMIRVVPFANFEKEGIIALKPTSWTGEKKAEISGVEPVNLSRRNLRHAKAYQAFLVRADMRWTDLTGANLREAELHGANLEGAWLRGANLKWAKFRWSRLLDAKLRGATLVGADLREADLRRADLRSADFTLAKLQGADLEAADLRWANLGYAQLQKQIEPRQEVTIQEVAPSNSDFESSGQWTNLKGADLSWATLTEANLQDADLKEAKLYGADLLGANLQGANLVGANLRQAYLQKAHLQGANLLGADLQEADLRNAIGLTIEQIELVMIGETTILPHYLCRPDYPGGAMPERCKPEPLLSQ
jgi:uncharacterized protein YjbI with pentapeptide repeats